jgi:four helix bundle protein
MGRDFRKLLAWQKTDILACEIYHITRGFPPEELYGGLASELRSAALGAVARIAEGAGRRSQEAFVCCLLDAQAELTATDYYLSLALRLGYLDAPLYAKLQELRADAAGLLYGFTIAVEETGREERWPPERAEAS